MKNYNRAFLDYYGEHNISPVAQDIEDLSIHFDRRRALYRHCGIPSQFLAGKRILEIGPGTGHNAIYTNAMKPERFVLLDGNPKSCEETQKTLNHYFDDLSNCEIIDGDLNVFSSEEKFDLVLCEGTIPIQKNPSTFLKRVAEYTAPGGVVIITCIDSVSFASECLRRVMARLIMADQKNTNETRQQAKALVPVFEPHLKNLQGMSRAVEDWILDNIMQPFIGELFSIEQSINALQEEFEAYGSSPNFLTDWRWYKNVRGDERGYNSQAINCYRSNIHNLLDYRVDSAPIDIEAGEHIQQLCDRIYASPIHQPFYQISEAELQEFADILQALNKAIEPLSTLTSQSLNAYREGISDYMATGKWSKKVELFQPWFGRGQQYISFIRNDISSQ